MIFEKLKSKKWGGWGFCTSLLLPISGTLPAMEQTASPPPSCAAYLKQVHLDYGTLTNSYIILPDDTKLNFVIAQPQYQKYFSFPRTDSQGKAYTGIYDAMQGNIDAGRSIAVYGATRKECPYKSSHIDTLPDVCWDTRDYKKCFETQAQK